MSYALFDYTESMNIAGIDPHRIERCVAAWGERDWNDEWAGGFLVKLKDGRFAYVTGSCDSSGWGCQDRADVTYYDAEPQRQALTEGRERDWDEEPADLNLWHARGCVDRYNSF